MKGQTRSTELFNQQHGAWGFELGSGIQSQLNSNKSTAREISKIEGGEGIIAVVNELDEATPCVITERCANWIA
ncbi:hypothetical protein FGLOB1_6114 [Fusarium globosum]|uniref:Uncharacterized protein n=1 Tax=Fusarium globosum TaxID=78864 RepID=A0A8H5YBG3_9HYPO|nr:hypothetical protein FGLOB1_6114 [Fusarium globosum]